MKKRVVLTLALTMALVWGNAGAALADAAGGKGLETRSYEVVVDSDGVQDWEIKNVTISEVADSDSYSISLGRNAFANAIRDDVGGTGNFTIYDIRVRLTSSTNLEFKYWDTLQTGSSIIPVFITAKFK